MTAMGVGITVFFFHFIHEEIKARSVICPNPVQSAGQSGDVRVSTHLHADMQARGQDPEQSVDHQSSHSGFWQVRSPLRTLGACMSFGGGGMSERMGVLFKLGHTHFHHQ